MQCVTGGSIICKNQNVLCNDFFKEHGAHRDLMILEEINFKQAHLHSQILIHNLSSLQISAGQFIYMHLHILDANGFCVKMDKNSRILPWKPSRKQKAVLWSRVQPIHISIQQ